MTTMARGLGHLGTAVHQKNIIDIMKIYDALEKLGKNTMPQHICEFCIMFKTSLLLLGRANGRSFSPRKTHKPSFGRDNDCYVQVDVKKGKSFPVVNVNDLFDKVTTLRKDEYFQGLHQARGGTDRKLKLSIFWLTDNFT